jgi:hypothetical protein
VSWNIICKDCKNPQAWTGFYSVHCPNQNCVNFTEKQKLLVEKEEQNRDAELNEKKSNDAGPAATVKEVVDGLKNSGMPGFFGWGVPSGMMPGHAPLTITGDDDGSGEIQDVAKQGDDDYDGIPPDMSLD